MEIEILLNTVVFNHDLRGKTIVHQKNNKEKKKIIEIIDILTLRAKHV